MLGKTSPGIEPGAQSALHALAAHVSFVAHFLPHAPQFASSFVRSAQYSTTPPSAPGRVQRNSPEGHVDWHAPLAHTKPAAHAFPHRPQSFGSVCRFTHALPQAVVAPAQRIVHTPATQPSPTAHVFAHDPQ
jgi:hypothetical protein